MPPDDNVIGEVPIPKLVGYLVAKLPVPESFGREVFVRPLTGRDHLDITFSSLPETIKLRELLARSIVEPKMTAEQIDNIIEPNVLCLGFAAALASRGKPDLIMRFVCPANERCDAQELGLDITPLAISDLEEGEQDGFTFQDTKFRYISLGESRRVEALLDENEIEAQREYISIATKGLDSKQGIEQFDGVLQERLRHATNVFSTTNCSSCGAEFKFVIRPLDLIDQSGLKGLLAEVETIARVLNWSPDSILALPDQLRRFYNERAVETAEKEREQAASARAKRR